MKKVIVKLKNNSLFTFILGIIICSGIICGANSYQSNAIEYSPTDSSWEVSNVSDAINSLYSMEKELENIKSIGDAASAQILSGKKAVVKGKTVTGTMTNRGSWTSTPTGSGKVTIPAGYHNGSGYVDTKEVYNSAVSSKVINPTLLKGSAQYASTPVSYTLQENVENGLLIVSSEIINLSTNGTWPSTPATPNFTISVSSGSYSLINTATYSQGNGNAAIVAFERRITTSVYKLINIPRGATITITPVSSVDLYSTQIIKI